MTDGSEIDLVHKPSALSALESIVKGLQAEVRKLKAEIKQLAKDQINIQSDTNFDNQTTLTTTTTTNDNENGPKVGIPANDNHADGTGREDAANENTIIACDDFGFESDNITIEKVENYHGYLGKKRFSDQTFGTQRTTSMRSFTDRSRAVGISMSGGDSNNTTVEIPDASSISDTSYDDSYDNEGEQIDVKRHLFANSTHRYLFMDTIERSDGTSYKVGVNHKIIAFFIVLFQSFAYLLFGYLTAQDYKLGEQELSTPTLQLVESALCYDTEAYPDPFWGHYKAAANGDAYDHLKFDSDASEFVTLDMLRCSDPTDLYNDKDDHHIDFLVGPLACWTLAIFLLPDFYGSFILIIKGRSWRDRLAGILISSKAVLAAVVGSIGFTVVYFTRASDTFLVMVGLLFVHEVDERVGCLEEIIERTREKKYFRVTSQFSCFFWFVCIPLYMVGVILYYIYIIEVSVAGIYFGICSGQAALFFVSAFVVKALARCRFKRKAETYV